MIILIIIYINKIDLGQKYGDTDYRILPNDENIFCKPGYVYQFKNGSMSTESGSRVDVRKCIPKICNIMMIFLDQYRGDLPFRKSNRWNKGIIAE